MVEKAPDQDMIGPRRAAWKIKQPRRLERLTFRLMIIILEDDGHPL